MQMCILLYYWANKMMMMMMMILFHTEQEADSARETGSYYARAGALSFVVDWWHRTAAAPAVSK